MHRNLEDCPEWFLIFTQAKYDHWIWQFVDRSMGHVYAVKDLNDYQWLIVQPRINITEVKILLKCQYPNIRHIAASGDKIVKVKARTRTEPRGTLNWFTCVEQIKALIGVRSAFTLTPKQLYNGLTGGRYGSKRTEST